jgi:hypothetical protein
MGDTINDGGPAFPAKTAMQTGPSEWRYEGMTLRDYLAAKAMQMEMQSARTRYDSGAIDAEEWEQVQAWVADYAYAMADAMLRARTGGQP